MDKKHILIVEDDEMLSKTLSERLVADGFDVIIETDGQAGLERVQKDIPDIVILDLTLPKLDGVDVLKKMRADSKTAHIPVIVSTNRDDIDTVSATLESGGLVDFLAKHEWKLDDIAALVRKRLEGRK
jgi:DNA-binding response OmpR family regulator